MALVIKEGTENNPVMSYKVNQTSPYKALNGNNHLKDPNRFGSTDQKECKYRNSRRTNYIDFQYILYIIDLSIKLNQQFLFSNIEKPKYSI